MATKRGTNQFHGAAYMFYFDTAVGAGQYAGRNNHTPFTFGSLSLPYTPLDFRTTATVSAARSAAPSLPKPFLGGKWYFFFNYEGLAVPEFTQLFDDPCLRR